MIRDLLILTAIGALVVLVCVAFMARAFDIRTERPRMCDGLSAVECTAMAQAEADALIKGGW